MIEYAGYASAANEHALNMNKVIDFNTDFSTTGNCDFLDTTLRKRIVQQDAINLENSSQTLFSDEVIIMDYNHIAQTLSVDI